MAAEAAERQLELLRDEREAEVAQSRCGTRGTGTRHQPLPPGGYGAATARGHVRLGGQGSAVTRGDHRGTLSWDLWKP